MYGDHVVRFSQGSGKNLLPNANAAASHRSWMNLPFNIPIEQASLQDQNWRKRHPELFLRNRRLIQSHGYCHFTPANERHMLEVSINYRPPASAPFSQSRAEYTTAVDVLCQYLHDIVKHPPPDFLVAYGKLNPVYKIVLANTMAFKFEQRERLPNDTSSRTPEASFFLDKLEERAPHLLTNVLHLVALKCLCCNNSSDYIAGCTSFIAFRDPEPYSLLHTAFRARLHHLKKCPFASRQLPSFVPTKQDLNDLGQFLKLWFSITTAAYFTSVIHTLPAPALNRKLTFAAPASRRISSPGPFSSASSERWREHDEAVRILEDTKVTEDSIYSDMVSSLYLGTQKGHFIFDDLSEHMDEITTPQMEIFLQSCRIHVDEYTNIQLRCNRCSNRESSGKLDISVMLQSTGAADEDRSHCERIWEFMTSHSAKCSNAPMSVKQLFKEGSSNPPMKNLESFLLTWKAPIQRLSKLSKMALSPKSDHDLYFPITIDKIATCSTRPLDLATAPRCDTETLVGSADTNDVILSEAYRDFEGNRRFRQVVSEYRGLYLNLLPNQQEVVAESIVKTIKKRGGSFYTVRSCGKVLGAQDEFLSYTTSALQHGFPDMLRRINCKNSSSKVYDLEFAPMIGIMNGLVKWKISTSSSPRVFIVDPSTGEIEHDYALPTQIEVEQERNAEAFNSSHSETATKTRDQSKAARQKSHEMIYLFEEERAKSESETREGPVKRKLGLKSCNSRKRSCLMNGDEKKKANPVVLL